MNSQEPKLIAINLEDRLPKFYQGLFSESLEIQIKPRKKIIRVKIN